jgi:hypothetical protein
MDQNTIERLVAEVAKHLPPYPWWTLLAGQAALTLLAAGFGAFLGEYLKIRGQNLATKADFSSLKTQLRANTELVETIKMEVSQRDWAKREWTTLRRMKLESLFERIHDCDDYIRQLIAKAATADVETVFQQRDPISEAERIVALYLPQLKDEFASFKETYAVLTGVAAMLMDQVVEAEAEEDTAAHARALEQTRHLVPQALPPFIEATRHLESAGRKLLLQIMEVAGSNELADHASSAHRPATAGVAIDSTVVGNSRRKTLKPAAGVLPASALKGRMSKKENRTITMLLDGIEGDAENPGLLKANTDAIATYDALIKRGNSVSFARAEIARVFLGCLWTAWEAGERGVETRPTLFADMCRAVRDGRSAVELFPDPVSPARARP